MRPQYWNGRTNHHYNKDFCRCCSSFGPSRHREGLKIKLVSRGAQRSRWRSADFVEQLDRTVYDSITYRLQYGDANITVF